MNTWLCNIQIRVEGKLLNELHFREQRGLVENGDFGGGFPFGKGHFVNG